MIRRQYEIQQTGWGHSCVVWRYAPSSDIRHYQGHFATLAAAEEFVTQQKQFDQEDYERSRI